MNYDLESDEKSSDFFIQQDRFCLSGCQRISAAAARTLNRFLPYVDNWATCDQMSPKVFRKHKRK